MSAARLLDVLRQLHHETFVSGEAAAQTLGCSRATVHNALLQAQEAGVRVQAVRGRGYRLAAPLGWLLPDYLRAELPKLGMTLDWHDVLDSTNSRLMDLAQTGAVHRTVVTAEWQSAGRGRRGRSWLAPPGAGIQFSLLWRFRRSVAELSGLSLAVGVLLARALHGLGLEQARVKWPNDIVAGNAKLAGVLIELAGDMLGPASAVIGVGLNVTGAREMEGRLGHAVTDMESHLGPMDRSHVLVRLLAALEAGLAEFDQCGFGPFQQDWHALHAYQGAAVTLTDAQGKRIHGKALGVDEQGALLLDADSGPLRFHAGEVSLRAAAP